MQHDYCYQPALAEGRPTRQQGGNKAPELLYALQLSLLGLVWLLSGLSAQAQTLLWQKTLGGTQTDYATALTSTNDGGMVIAGYTSSTDGDVTGQHGGGDFWVVKLDAQGNLLWQKTLGGTQSEVPWAIKATSDGGVVVAGYTQSTDGDVTGNKGTSDFWVVKLDAQGNLLWQKTLGGTGIDQAYGLTTTSDEGVVVAGYTQSTNGDVTGTRGNRDFWVVKLDAQGNLLWQKTLGGTGSDAASGITTTSDGGLVVVGYTSSTNGDVTGQHGGADFWVVKLDAQGNLLWQKTLGGTGYDYASSIATSSDGGLVVAGTIESTNGDVTGNHGDYDMWVVKLDAQGSLLWQKTLGGSDYDESYALTATGDGGYVVAGNVYSTDGDVTGNHGDSDSWVAKLDAQGNLLWQKALGGSDDDEAFGVMPSGDRDLVVVGDAYSNDGDVTGHQGRSDFWIVKLRAPIILSSFTSGASTVCAGNPLTFTATVGELTGSYDYTLTNGTSTTSGTSASTSFSENLVASGSGPQNFTLTVSNNGQSATAITNVTVTTPPILNPITGNPNLLVGATTQLANATMGGIWSSDNPTIASVSATGLVSALAVGSTQVRYTVAAAGGCPAVEALYLLTVSEPAPDGPTCDTYTTRTTANGLGSNNSFSVYAVGNIVYAATQGGLSISTDGGNSFTNKTTANGLGSNFVIRVHAVGNVVYAATLGGGLSISTDGGNTFTNKTTANGLGSNNVVGIYVVGSMVYATTDGGLSISSDGGNSFTNKTTANGLGSNIVRDVYVVSNVVYAATAGGLSISTDGGNSFTTRTTANGLISNDTYVVQPVGNVIYVATGSGLGISADGGNSFTNRTTANGLGSNFVTGVYVLGNVVYTTTDGGLSISTDGGNNFTNRTTANGIGNNNVYGVSPLGSRIYVATVGGGLSFCPAPATPLLLSNFTASPTTLLTTASTSLSAVVTGGTGPYNYVFSGPGIIGPSGNTATISGLSAGVQTFTVTVSDATVPTNQTISGTVSVTVIDNMPTISTFQSNPAVVCAGSPVAFTATVGNVTGSYSYTLTNGISTTTGTTSNPSFSENLLASGNGPQEFTLTVSSNGQSATATTNVTVNALPTATILTPASTTLTCTNASLSLTATGGATYRWEDNSTDAVRSVSSSGTYSVTVTSASGCTAEASTSIAQDNMIPTVSITPNSTTLTCSTPIVNLSAVGTGTYQWSTGETTQVISVTAATTYSVTLTGTNGCSTTANATVSQDITLPNVSITPSTGTPAGVTLTCANPTVSLSAVGSTGTYRWSTGATTSVISVTTANTYSVTLIGTNGCTASASVIVSQDNSLPSLSISPNSATLTCSTPTLSLSAVGTGTYRWSTGEITQTISVSTANTYSVTLTGTNSCTTSASVVVGQDNTAPTVSITPSTGTPAGVTLTCATPTVSLSAVGNGTYRWSTGETSQVISATSANTYSVTLTTTNGCTASASATVGQDITLPTVSISPNSATLTCASPTVSLNAVGSGTYRWNTTATTPVISASAAGTYSVTLTATNGCTATASVQVFQDNTLSTVSINPASATLTCATPTVSLSVVGTGTLRWNTGATTQAISATSAGTYSVTLTATNGCTTTASATVTQDTNLPTVSIAPSIGTPTGATLTCANPVVSLSAVGSGTYRWSTGATTPTISVSTANTYSLTLTSGNGCSATASIQVGQDTSLPTVSITANPSLTIATGQSTTLTASGATSYLWSNGATTNFILVNTATTYSVTGTTGNGCSATASVVVSLTSAPSGPFAISAVTTNTCQQIASNRYVISFTPQYAGTNGQPISFSVVNELFPTTAPGPYTLQLYTDNPVIILKAQQGGTPGEVTYAYNWLAVCSSPQPNTPPRVNQPLTDQIARVGEGFGYTIPQVTFTDNESPQSLVLTVSGLPAGLGFMPPTQIGGVPTVAGVRSITVTASDPQGLSVSTSFVLTVVEPNATNTPPTLVNPISAQAGIQEQPFSLNVGTTFSDAQTPNALVLTASGLPVGLTLAGTLISGTPSMSGTSTVSLTAVDPGGLSATTSFMLTIQPASVTASAPFAITGVSPITCTQVANNRYQISFQPRYSGLNGQVVNFWVVNELVPTTAPGPYSLQLYNDNPVIVLKARQEGSAGETTFSYNWLASCGTPPQPNSAPRVNIPLTNQTARVGQAFGYTIPQLTFTDNETPQSLVLSVSGLPAGMSFSAPTQIGGVPSVSGVSTITVTATDPAGLSVNTQFSLTVLPVNAPSGFAITSVQTLNCVSLSPSRRSVTFTPQYSGTDGSPVSFSIINELLPTTTTGPYTLELYTDNSILRLRAQQGGSQASYDYNWLAVCSTPARQGVAEAGTGLQVSVLGNPVIGSRVEVMVRGIAGQSLTAELVDLQGHRLGIERIERAGEQERLSLPIDRSVGVLLLEVRTASERQVIRLVQP
ncbi:hypothetical protein GCM10027592_53320 [Spirosoma flavus]